MTAAPDGLRLLLRAGLGCVGSALLSISALCFAADLTIGDGAVIKFGASAELVVRDRLSVGGDAALTSERDSSIGGQVRSGLPAPTAGAWRGIKLEKSAGEFSLSLGDPLIRYAGSDNAAALSIRGFSPNVSFLRVRDSTIGVRLLDGANARLTGFLIKGNATGVEADGDSAAQILQSTIESNTSGVVNRTPSTVVQATGNWWGHASGPRDPVGNPAGQGDSVSSGVNYGSYLASAPLTNPAVRIADPRPFFDQSFIALILSCVNATEYRVAENGAFGGVAFVPLTDGRASVQLPLSAGDGVKPVSAQFRDAAGNIVTANLAGGVLVDTQGPTVAITVPAADSIVLGQISVEATATDATGITRVEFYVDGAIQSTDTSAPYAFNWDTAAFNEGDRQLRVVATDGAGRASEVTRNVTVTRFVPPADVDGPAIANARLDAVPLANGLSITRNATVSATVTDRSGVARVELLLDGSVVSTATGTSDFTAALDISALANGPRTLAVRAFDSLNNATTLSYNVSIAHAPPTVPTLTQPQNGLTTRFGSVVAAGTAVAGTSVQLFVNSVATGAPLIADSNGAFGTTLTLANGQNRIQAQATDAHGSSPLSPIVTVTVDTAVPLPAANLVATAQSAGTVRLAWVRSTDPSVVGYDVYRSSASFTALTDAVRANTAPVNNLIFEDVPRADAEYFYRVVAVNAVRTPSDATNLAQGRSDSTLPRANSVVYLPQGRVDPVTGRFGQGRVDVTLTVSEPLQATPYLALGVEGAAPISIVLSRQSDTVYIGSFTVDASTASGVATSIFSARDAVGNRGTEVDAGRTVGIDTTGPAVTAIALTPAAPIRADTGSNVTATFTVSEPLKNGTTPDASFLLSGAGRTPTPITGMTALNPTSWRGTFTLPANAGASAPEFLSFTFRAIDELDNVSTLVAAPNSFQVYQGNLPPSAIPAGLRAEARPAGRVRLTWQTVSEAASYQIYRQAPGESVLTPLVRSTTLEYIDATTQDGVYRYAVASVRQFNQQETLSAQSALVDATARRDAPGAPQNLQLTLTGQGIRALWQAPVGGNVTTYNIYRAAGLQITSTDGLTPLRSGIVSAAFIDANPSTTEHAYVVTGLDAAGNESAISNSAYLNSDLLPVASLRIDQAGNGLPVISWTASRRGAVGYNVYVGPDNNRVKLNPSLLTALTYTDNGYVSGERRYTVAAVDANAVEIGRSIVLPSAGAQIASGLPIKRGIPNRLQVQVSNTSSSAVADARVVVRAGNVDHRSALLNLASNETRLVPVIVGGYDTLTNPAALTVGIEVVPNEGELVNITRASNAEVIDGALAVGFSTENFTRGGTGRVRLSIENTSDVDIELLTARTNGSLPSDELRFKLLDNDNNVLATQSFLQAFGANVITLTNGLTVARIPTGASYTSDPFELRVPGGAPDRIRVRLEVDKVRYHSGDVDEVLVKGRGAETAVSLIDTAYYGEVTGATPPISFGDVDVVINGRSVDRATSQPLPNARLKLILNQEGFERVVSVTTDPTGLFTYRLTPGVTDGGLYRVAAVHPEITDRPDQRSFVINRVRLTPLARVSVPPNYPFAINLQAVAGPGTSATNLRLVFNAASQPTGQLPEGVTLALPAPINIVARQTLNVPVTFTADSRALRTGTALLDVVADGSATPIGQVRIEYVLTEARPILVATPNVVNTGMAQGGIEIESLVLENRGILPVTDLRTTLTLPDGSPAPAWATLITPSDVGTLAVGEKRTIEMNFAPPSGISEGIYRFLLKVEGSNYPADTVPIFASVTQSGIGNVLFKASDIYTATLNRQGQLIQGLANASIEVQNEDVPSVQQRRLTDDFGETFFEALPAGRYKFRARASNHQELGGRFQIKPGVTFTQPVFLEYNVVTVEWTVREITIEDRYEIILTATFETDVPAAVVVQEPPSVNLPKMRAGEVFNGEIRITNYGLIRADNVRQTLPTTDSFFKFEFLTAPPTSLEAKQSVRIPYRITALRSLEEEGGATGGGCYTYTNVLVTNYEYTCANGTLAVSRISTTWASVSQSTCPAGPGGPGPIYGGGGPGPGGGGGIGGGGGGYSELPGLPPCVKCACIKCGTPGGAGGGNPQ